MTSMHIKTAPHEHYNQLSEIFDADSNFKKRDRKDCLVKLFEVIDDYDLSREVGIRLLHKHNDIHPGEMMVESATIDKNGFSLVTKPASLSDRNDICVNSWQITDSGYVPVEFSTTHLIMNPLCTPENQPHFFRSFGEALVQLELQEILGPGLLPSEFVERHKISENDIQVEISLHHERANVVRFANSSNYNLSNMVEASWHRDKSMIGGRTTPEVYTKCTRICPYVQNPPVHQGTFVHNRD